MGKIPVKEIVSVVSEIVGDKDVQKTFLGTYSDGSTRSVGDAFTGEVLSPKDKENYMYKKPKKKGKKKKPGINLD